jgi:carboxy-terminal domain RNA polymerase II polypeptide A small phosphatase
MYIKDMERLGRKISDIILLDNSPISYIFQPENGMPIKNWYEDRDDTELLQYGKVLERLAFVDDV